MRALLPVFLPWVAKLCVTASEIRTLSRSYSQNGLASESRSCMAVIDCCKALGVNHSFGKQRCRKGTQELKWASRFTQLGISCPQRICVTAPEKWLQLLFIKWYRSPRNWLPSSSTIRRTSSSVKSVQPIWILGIETAHQVRRDREGIFRTRRWMGKGALRRRTRFRKFPHPSGTRLVRLRLYTRWSSTYRTRWVWPVRGSPSLSAAVRRFRYPLAPRDSWERADCREARSRTSQHPAATRNEAATKF